MSSVRKIAKVDAKPGGPLSLGSFDNNTIERFRNLEKDLGIVTRKLSDLQNISNPENSSTFVHGMRSTIELNRGDDDAAKLKHLDKIIAKITELDREVLRRTENVIAIQPRRGSRDQDLHIIPTHLHVVDRLLDYHVQLKRAIDNNNSSHIANNTMSANEIQYENEIKTLRKNAVEIQDRCNKYKGLYESTLLEYESYKNNNTLTSNDQEIKKYRDEINSLKTQLQNSIDSNISFENIIEKNHASEQLFVNVMYNICNEMNQINTKSESNINGNKSDNNDGDIDIEALISLYNNNNLMQIFNSIILSKNIHINNHGSTSNTSTSMLYKSLHSLIDITHNIISKMISHNIQNISQNHNRKYSNEEYQLLDKHFNEYKTRKENEINLYMEKNSVLETEIINFQKRMMNNDKQYHKIIEDNNLKINELQSKVNNSVANNDELLRYQNEITDLNSQMNNLQIQLLESNEKYREMELQINFYKNEMNSYMELNEKLKSKIKELSFAGSTSKNSNNDDADKRNFADTFEEVMRDELATMKRAFEAKLHAAKLEREEISKRHQMEIVKMQSSNSATRLGINAGNSAANTTALRSTSKAESDMLLSSRQLKK
jgi:hypothetical protein